MKQVLVLAVLLFSCACSSQPTAAVSPSPTSSPSASPTPVESPSPAGETPVDKQILPPAENMPVVPLCSATLQTTSDGNAIPLLCHNGGINVLAWKYYSSISASILGLGLNPTQGQAVAAICDDINHNHATKPEEASGYKLAATYYGWTFGLDPTKVTCT